MATTKTPDRSGYFAVPVAPDFLIEIAKEKMPGYDKVRIYGVNPTLSNTAETIWPVGGRWQPLSTDTELFISSTDAADTTQVITVKGVDSNYAEITRTATLNGQNQVSLGNMFRVNTIEPDLEVNGSIYVAESDTLTAGVPDTSSKIQALMPYDSDVDKSFAVNTSFIYTVPAGKTLFLNIARFYVENLSTNKDIRFWVIRETSPNEAPGVLVCGDLSSGFSPLELINFREFKEKTTWSVAAISPSGTASIAHSVDGILIENDQF